MQHTFDAARVDEQLSYRRRLQERSEEHRAETPDLFIERRDVQHRMRLWVILVRHRRKSSYDCCSLRYGLTYLPSRLVGCPPRLFEPEQFFERGMIFERVWPALQVENERQSVDERVYTLVLDQMNESR